MKSTFSWLMVFFAVIFWIFRVVITFAETMEIDFPIKPIESNLEIVLLFFTVLCIALIFKRKIIGAILYFISYGAYFGTDIYNQITLLINGEVANTTNIVFSAIGIIIPLILLIDISINKDGTSSKGKNTNWFYSNEKYERQLDERADKNQYKF